MFGKYLILSLIVITLLSCSYEEVESNNKTEMLDEEVTSNVSTDTHEEEVNETYIEEDDSDNPKLPAVLTYMGRASMRIEFADETLVYIDPFAGENSEYEKPADLVLVTHQHSDHNQTSRVSLKEGGEIVMCPLDIVAGENMTLYGISIEAVAAYNSNHAKSKNCGYLLKISEMTLYHAGDTSYIPEMLDLVDDHIDFAFIPVDGFYNMGPEEAKLVAETIAAEVVIPIHTDGKLDWNIENANKLDLDNKLIVLPGESIEIK